MACNNKQQVLINAENAESMKAGAVAPYTSPHFDLGREKSWILVEPA